MSDTTIWAHSVCACCAENWTNGTISDDGRCSLYGIQCRQCGKRYEIFSNGLKSEFAIGRLIKLDVHRDNGKYLALDTELTRPVATDVSEKVETVQQTIVPAVPTERQDASDKHRISIGISPGTMLLIMWVTTVVMWPSIYKYLLSIIELWR